MEFPVLSGKVKQNPMKLKTGKAASIWQMGLLFFAFAVNFCIYGCVLQGHHNFWGICYYRTIEEGGEREKTFFIKIKNDTESDNFTSESHNMKNQNVL